MLAHVHRISQQRRGKLRPASVKKICGCWFFFFGNNYLYLSSSPWLVYFLYIFFDIWHIDFPRQLFIPRASGESSCGPTFGAGSPGLGGWGGTWKGKQLKTNSFFLRTIPTVIESIRNDLHHLIFLYFFEKTGQATCLAKKTHHFKILKTSLLFKRTLLNKN